MTQPSVHASTDPTTPSVSSHDGEPTLTDLQVEVLLALNLRQMQDDDSAYEDWGGVCASEIAAMIGRSTRSVATSLSRMRSLGWVGSIHGFDAIGWRLLRGAVDALDANRERTRGLVGGAPAEASR